MKKTWGSIVLVLVLVLTLLAPSAEAASAVGINKKNFPDAKFRSYISENFDINGNGTLNSTEISRVTEINVGKLGIKSLKGVEKFTALKYLDCGYNKLTSLDVSANTALESLYCHNNQLTSLDVSANTALKHLDCSDNQLTTLDVRKNTALLDLDCNDNELTTLDVSMNRALVELSCSYNKLTSLDVKKNTKLKWFGCGDNKLTTLDVSANTALEYLLCFRNRLTVLDVSANTALKSLSCDENQLTTLDVSKNTALTSIDCSDNRLTSLNVRRNTALDYLACYGNRLTKLDISRCSGLRKAYISGTTEQDAATVLHYQYKNDRKQYNFFVDMTMKIITVSVNTQPKSVTAAKDELVRFTAKGAGTGLSYQWQFRTSAGGKWINITSATAGGNTATLKVIAKAARNGYEYRCVITDMIGNTAISKTATLTVK